MSEAQVRVRLTAAKHPPRLPAWRLLFLMLCMATAGLTACRTDDPSVAEVQARQSLPAGMVRLVLRRVTWISGDPAVEAALRPMDQLPAPMRPDARLTAAATANGLIWRWTDPVAWKQIEDRGLIRDVSWSGSPSSTLLMPGWIGRLEVRRALLADRPTRLSLEDARGQRQEIEGLITGSGCFARYQVLATGDRQVELTPYFQQNDPGQAIVLSDLRCRLIVSGQVVYVLTAVPVPVFEARQAAVAGPVSASEGGETLPEIFMGPSLTAHGSRRVGLVVSVEGM